MQHMHGQHGILECAMCLTGPGRQVETPQHQVQLCGLPGVTGAELPHGIIAPAPARRRQVERSELLRQHAQVEGQVMRHQHLAAEDGPDVLGMVGEARLPGQELVG